jgi:hypothetical protein
MWVCGKPKPTYSDRLLLVFILLHYVDSLLHFAEDEVAVTVISLKRSVRPDNVDEYCHLLPYGRFHVRAIGL